jgi:hypothetical protein
MVFVSLIQLQSDAVPDPTSYSVRQKVLGGAILWLLYTRIPFLAETIQVV